jgi:MioC protein
MLNEYAIHSRRANWINWLSRISIAKPKPTRIYDYSQAVPGVDYVFDKLSEKDSSGYMTSQKSGVKQGEQILLTQNGTTRKYQIQELDYYSSPSDMWIALLTEPKN